MVEGTNQPINQEVIPKPALLTKMRNFGFWQRGRNSIEHLSSNFVPIRHLYICREPSTNSPLFMQNKPNLLNTRISITPVAIKNYSENDVLTPPKNKPKQTQFKANQSQSPKRQNECKLNFNKGLQKKRCFHSPKNKPNSNPIQTQFMP